MQKWRRGCNIEMPISPKEFGLAIDDCIRILRKITDEQFNSILKDASRQTNRTIY